MFEGTNPLPLDFAATRSRSVSLAILKANWDEGSSYIDNFVPFVAEVLRGANGAVTQQELGRRLEETFGFVLPVGVLATVVKRAAARGLVETLPQRRLLGVAARLNDLRMDQVRDDTMRCQRALVRGLVGFAQSVGVTIVADEADELLMRFIERFGLRSVRPVHSDTHRTPDVPDELRVVALYADGLRDSDPAGFEYLLRIVQGSMLASAVFLPADAAQTRQIRPMTAFLDTRLILDLLGLHGDIAHRATQQLVEIAQKDGLRVAVFERTVAEVRSVIQRAGRQPKAMSPVARHLRQQALSKSDYELLALRVPIVLDRLGVATFSDPTPDGWDSDGRSRSRLASAVRYTSDGQLEHDLMVIGMVARRRNRPRVAVTEDTEAVFVTSNSAVADAMARGDEDTTRFRRSWPLCMSANEFATVVWLRNPTLACDLPASQLVAACYAAFQPSASTFEHYFEELRAIQAAGEVTADEMIFFQVVPEVDRALAEQSLRKRGGIDRVATTEIIANVRERIRGDAVSGVGVGVDLPRGAAPSATSDTLADAAPINQPHLELLARSFGRKVRLGVTWTCLSAAILGGLTQVVGWHGTGWPRAGLVLSSLLLGILSVMSLRDGSHVVSIAGRMGERARMWRLKRLQAQIADEGGRQQK